ncbi:hypothetical protein [Mycoplasmopsis bovis]|uniref:hypothetical protein n=1 Tax=Mycoplasmopsis bovis TaxID=28903 RepID=UPI003D298E3B
MSASTLPSAINADTFSNPKFNILNAAFGPMPLSIKVIPHNTIQNVAFWTM